MTLRAETPQDAAEISALTSAAFATEAHASGTEAQIVERLRKADALLLSIVCEEGGRLVGHIAASPVLVGGQPGWAGIGPLSVLPDLQRSGIGSALMTEALRQLRALGQGGVVLVGDPGYYTRFGFVADPALHVRGIPAEYVLSQPFASRRSGGIRFHPAFGLEG
ncbi:putative acetyltransferase [Gemmobacter aquatilis]|uniref:Putative acetyltransferase n=1 Tax=Gemmobacter aquatilis TaxID=933059 RepID=A0A1H8HYU8_9RHOB|nr:N-acetyltransferase [Gemmobacter aquatilis]SEN61211.1 putative acetyltransferase [Gemmobacter aquatilis]